MYCTNDNCHHEFHNDDSISSEDRCRACQTYWDRNGIERPGFLVRQQRARQQRQWDESEEGRAWQLRARNEREEREARYRVAERWAPCSDCGLTFPAEDLNRDGRCDKCKKKYYKNPDGDRFDYEAWQAEDFAADEWDVAKWKHDPDYFWGELEDDDDLDDATGLDDLTERDEAHTFEASAEEVWICAQCGQHWRSH
jgi:predicted Zn-ribbon and HTH transcriptional regulator